MILGEYAISLNSFVLQAQKMDSVELCGSHVAKGKLPNCLLFLIPGYLIKYRSMFNHSNLHTFCFFIAWSVFIDETERMSKLVKENAEFLATETTDKLNTLYTVSIFILGMILNWQIHFNF